MPGACWYQAAIDGFRKLRANDGVKPHSRPVSLESLMSLGLGSDLSGATLPRSMCANVTGKTKCRQPGLIMCPEVQKPIRSFPSPSLTMFLSVLSCSSESSSSSGPHYEDIHNLHLEYCSEPCLKQHWHRHRSDCAHPYLKADWQPRWVTEGRQPSFASPPVNPSTHSSNRLWGGVPAVDCLQMAYNEGWGGDVEEKDVKLCFAGMSPASSL